MDHQFKFGDKVWNTKHGTGVVIGTDQIVRVFFEEGIVIGFYATKVANEDMLISELMPVSDWIDVNEKTPAVRYEHNNLYVSQSVMVTDSEYHGYYTGFGHINDNGEWVIYRADVDFMNPQKVTHWQPIPQLPR